MQIDGVSVNGDEAVVTATIYDEKGNATPGAPIVLHRLSGQWRVAFFQSLKRMRLEFGGN